jgi:hypothetical protein
MPDQSSAATEHAILQEITAPLATFPDDAVEVAANPDFPMVLRGYDRLAVDAYVKKTTQMIAELQATRSPEAAVRRALERVGEQISGILQRAHDTAEQITTQSRSEAEDRLEVAREEGRQIAAKAQERVRELDNDTDRIWSERLRIVEDARELARQLLALAESAADRFPAGEPADPQPSAEGGPEPGEGRPFDGEDEEPGQGVVSAPREGDRPLPGIDDPADAGNGLDGWDDDADADADDLEATAVLSEPEQTLRIPEPEAPPEYSEDPDPGETAVLPPVDPETREH